MSRLFMPRVAQAGLRLDTFQDLMAYLANCIDTSAPPELRDMSLTPLLGPSEDRTSVPTPGSAPSLPDWTPLLDKGNQPDACSPARIAFHFRWFSDLSAHGRTPILPAWAIRLESLP